MKNTGRRRRLHTEAGASPLADHFQRSKSGEPSRPVPYGGIWPLYRGKKRKLYKTCGACNGVGTLAPGGNEEHRRPCGTCLGQKVVAR